MNTGHSHRLQGYLLLETLVALSIATVLTGALSGVVVQSLQHTRTLTDRLQQERMLTAAQATAYALLRSGESIREVTGILTTRYPGLEVSRQADLLLLDGGSAGVLEIPTGGVQ